MPNILLDSTYIMNAKVLEPIVWWEENWNYEKIKGCKFNYYSKNDVIETLGIMAKYDSEEDFIKRDSTPIDHFEGRSYYAKWLEHFMLFQELLKQ